MKNVPTEQNVEDFSPYTLLRNFSKNRVLPCVFVAVILHVAVIGGLSYQFIYTTWIDPSSKAPGYEGTNEATADPSETDGVAGKENPSAAAAATKDGDKPAGTEPSDDTNLDAPVVREITDKAKPDEIPKDPDDFGISIDDTNQ
jgi:hypothetical protein